MYGQKQIISCLSIVILLTVFNFYRSVIKRDKEIRANRQTAALLKRNDAELVPESPASSPQEPSTSNINLLNHKLIPSEPYHYFDQAKMLEYPDICLDIHALVFRPNYDKISDTLSFDKKHGYFCGINHNGISDKRNSLSSATIQRNSQNRICDCCTDETEVEAYLESTSSSASMEDVNRNNVKIEKIMEKSLNESSGLVYVFIFILLVLLGKAAFDISKQLKEQRSKNENENDLLRRYSLHDYSLMKKRKCSRAMEPLMKKSVITQRSLDSGTKSIQQSEINRRLSSNPLDYHNGSGLITEPGTPPKPGNLIAGRPAPLLRRCSVPVFANKNPAHHGIARRPSMDSFSEGDSSPDVKRRVRMIQRH